MYYSLYVPQGLVTYFHAVERRCSRPFAAM